MKTFKISFIGRNIGAIGKTYKITTSIEAHNEEGAKFELYERFEHITNVKILSSKYLPFTHFFVCHYSQTIRVYPQNYWIASLKEGKLIFDSCDGAIIGRYTKQQINTLWDKINQVKEDNKKLNPAINGRFAVIVETNNILGVQYWTDWQIKNKVQANTDKTQSYFITRL